MLITTFKMKHTLEYSVVIYSGFVLQVSNVKTQPGQAVYAHPTTHTADFNTTFNWQPNLDMYSNNNWSSQKDCSMYIATF
jgi:hypothetical protein